MDLKDLHIKGEVATAEADLVKVSHDASIFELKPEVLIAPANTQDLQTIVRWVKERKAVNPKLSLTARSAGTDMSGGPLSESIVLNFLPHFDHLLEVGDGFAITEPGVFYRDFEKATLAKGWLLPSYPASRELCTMGGIVANNSGGEKSLIYGKTERYVEELEVVLSDGSLATLRALNSQELETKKAQQNLEGQIYREMHQLLEQNYDAIMAAKPDVSKNSAGYFLWNVWDKKTFDLTKLVVGSQGTLALVTKIKLRLVKPKKFSTLLVMFLNDLGPLGELVNAVMAFKPESFETYDDQTLKMAMKFLPDLMKKMGLNFFSLVSQFLPEMGMVITGGFPKIVLLAEFTGDNKAQVELQAEQARASLKRFAIKTHITETEAEEEKYWTIRRESFNLLRKHVHGKHTAPFIDDVVVHVNQLPTFLPKLNELVKQYKGLTYTIAGHAGDANFHVIPLMDFKDQQNRDAILELSEKVYDLVVSLKGSITGEHNDGLIRTPYLEKMYGPKIIDLFNKTKQIFDPQNIFNPGKKVHPQSAAYLMAHMMKD
jgi:FAD/FMN-containing dehydrogenase